MTTQVTIIEVVVDGLDAKHTIKIVPPVHHADVDAMMVAYRGRVVGQEWTAENGAGFKTVGAATGWLKKLLKKHGWPTATTWSIRTTSYGSVEEYRSCVTVELE